VVEVPAAREVSPAFADLAHCDVEEELLWFVLRSELDRFEVRPGSVVVSLPDEWLTREAALRADLQRCVAALTASVGGWYLFALDE
jgi:hypothetical protein